MMMRRAMRRTARRVALESLLFGRTRLGEYAAPDFIIAGAQRCGTTSLFRALANHPAVMPNLLHAKGAHYFDTSYHQNEAWYHALFASQHDRAEHSKKVQQKAIVGEASPYYLFHPAVPARMAKTVPRAKIIVLLRNPVKRAISHHQHMVWEGHESELDLNKALDLESTRLAGIEPQLLSDHRFVSRAHQHYSYLARGHYADQLERLYSYFDQSSVLVMATETLVSDSQSSLSTIQRFLGLEPDPSIDLEQRNASSKSVLQADTVERLENEYRESNRRLKGMVNCEIPWL